QHRPARARREENHSASQLAMKMQHRPRSRAKEEDRAARASGFPNRRAHRHWNRVTRLRDLLNEVQLPDSDRFSRVIAIKGYYPAHRDLFTLRECADAVCGSAKVIRTAERSGMIESERLP